MIKQTSAHYFITVIITGLLIMTMLPIHAHSYQQNELDDFTINSDFAIYIAEQFLFKKEKQIDYIIQWGEPLLDTTNDVHLGYVFYLFPIGYIIVSSSKMIQPVIAYSFTSSAPMDNQFNPLQSLLTVDISSQLTQSRMLSKEQQQILIARWDNYGIDPPIEEIDEEFQQWPPEGSTTTEGWIETQWDQYAPYNNFCPIDPTDGGKRSVAGCPSITMGQILNYHQTINQIQFDDVDDYPHNYLSSFIIDNDHIAFDFPSFPILNNYLSTVEQHYENNTPITDDDLAALTFACGIACKQIYSSSYGSGTEGVDQAISAY